jgi:hypothetical protein
MTRKPDQGRESLFEAPYDIIFKGILRFRDLGAAEVTISRIEALRKGFATAGDLKGMRYCRRIALLGRRRAEQTSRNKRVCFQKRLQKEEVGIWFQMWLENPELFSDWLAMRKKAPSFQALQQALECRKE